MNLRGYFKKQGARFSLREWQMRLLGLKVSETPRAGRGLVLLQIDGLSNPDLQAALKKGHMPFLSWLLRREHYRLHPVYSGIPSNTPAFQGEFFFGKAQCVPAFQFRDRKTQKVFTMFEHASAGEMEKRLLLEGEGLMAGGSAYGNIFSGGAAESHICASTADWVSLLKAWNPYALLVTWIMSPFALVRAVLLCGIEAVLAFFDFVRGAVKGQDVLMEWSFIFMRVLGSILMRELATAHARMDIYRGLPVVQVNFLGYDEQAHRRGPSTRFAYWSLSGIDRAIRKIWKAAMSSQRGSYDVWIYSDHGQVKVTPFEKAAGLRIQDAVQKLFEETQASMKGHEPYRPSRGRRAWGDTVMGTAYSANTEKNEDAARPVVTTLGPISQIYFPEPLADEDKKSFAAALLQKYPALPLIAVPLKNGEILFETHGGTRRLPEDAEALLGAEHPYLKKVARDLVSLLSHESRGDLMLFGWCAGAAPVSFSNENGSHAGLTSRETQAFALLPSDTPLDPEEDDVIRASDLRLSAQIVLGKVKKRDKASGTFQTVSRDLSKLRVLSYNVHSCVGTDGLLSVPRIARVIAKANPDVVALQELDAGRRILGCDQAAAIARELEMQFHFHPVCGEETEAFGNAILSRYPVKKIQAWHLPALAKTVLFEPRGVLWVEVDFNGRPVQVLTTHLSIWVPELKRQMASLLGPKGLSQAGEEGPVIFCGDFNFSPGSEFYKKLAGWEDVHRDLGIPGRTWISQWPVRRLDYILKKGNFSAEPVLLARTSLERTASDHLPVAADFSFPAHGGAPHERKS